LETASAQHPHPGLLPVAHRLSRTEYKNAVRDLLALPVLPREYDFSTLLPPDNVSSGFDNLADTLFMSPSATERYVEAARKIARIAVGDLTMEPLVNMHPTPVRTPQEQRQEDLPFGTRGGVSIDGYFPLDGEYEFAATTSATGREAHTLEITVDGVTRASRAISSAARPEDFDPEVGDRWKFRFAVKAGARPVQEHERRRAEAGEQRRVALRSPAPRQNDAGAAGERPQRRSRTVDDQDRHEVGNHAPVPPKVKLAQVVRAHDPDEMRARRPAFEPNDGFVGVARPDLGLESGDGDARIARQAPRRFDPRAHLGEARRQLQRVARRRQPPQAVEAQPPQRQLGNQPMPFVRRVEGAAEQADRLARREWRQAHDHRVACAASSCA